MKVPADGLRGVPPMAPKKYRPPMPPGKPKKR